MTGSVSTPAFSRAPHRAQILALQAACRWLEIDQGRATAYVRLVREFHQDGARTEAHILGFNESCEITDLYQLWESHAEKYPGLRRSLRLVCRKGPTLREAENPRESTNRPRNDAFSYLVAGTLLASGVAVEAVEGTSRAGAVYSSRADVCLLWEGVPFDVECKRPQVEEEVIPRFKEARAQIEDPHRGKREGVVAIDCSAFIRAPGALLKYGSVATGENKISELLEVRVAASLVPYFTRRVLGLMLFARVPGVMELPPSRILDSRGSPVRLFRQDSMITWLLVRNSRSERSGVLAEISRHIEAWQKSVAGGQHAGQERS